MENPPEKLLNFIDIGIIFYFLVFCNDVFLMRNIRG